MNEDHFILTNFMESVMRIADESGKFSFHKVHAKFAKALGKDSNDNDVWDHLQEMMQPFIEKGIIVADISWKQNGDMSITYTVDPIAMLKSKINSTSESCPTSDNADSACKLIDNSED